MSYSIFSEMQEYTVQRDTKAKEYETSCVGTLRLFTLMRLNKHLSFSCFLHSSEKKKNWLYAS